MEISCRVGRGIRGPRYMCRGKSVRLNELPRDGESWNPNGSRVPSPESRTISQEQSTWGASLNAYNVRNFPFPWIRGIEPLRLDGRRSLQLARITGSLTRSARSALMLPAGLKLQLTTGGIGSNYFYEFSLVRDDTFPNPLEPGEFASSNSRRGR